MKPIALVNFRFPKIFQIPVGPAQDRFAAASNFRRSLMKVEAATKAKKTGSIIPAARPLRQKQGESRRTHGPAYFSEIKL
jgi:hypothetical protein